MLSHEGRHRGQGICSRFSSDFRLTDIDDMLDFLEDVGLYRRADQISPELAHHHFFHWTRGYWQAAKPYIQAWREKEPARWSHVEELFDTGCEILNLRNMAEPANIFCWVMQP